MSRLWSRFGFRALSVALLVVAVAGGLYLSRDRDAQLRVTDAAVASEGRESDDRLIQERAASRVVATSRQRAAQRQAAAKAAAAAKKAALQARRVDDAATKEKEAASTESGGGSKATVPYTGPVPASCNEFAGNRKTGCALMLARGFALDQFPCLNKLWNRESGWNHRARNPSSGAYGIPQALPGDKMASVGSDWENNPATQIKWGLGYIKGRYGNPCGAWQHSEDVGWY